MELDLTGPLAEDAYTILSALITPRPIALTTTVDENGHVNAAPFSFFNLLGDSPPIVGLCPGDRAPGIPKDTARNIRLTQQFVVNMVDETLAAAMNLCAAPLPAGESELDFAHLTPSPSSVVTPPRIAESPVSLECQSLGIFELGENRLIIGQVLRVHVRDGVFAETESWRLQPGTYLPIGRMEGPSGYCRTRDRFEMQRPR
ncbi:MAG: flavin reductase family protein [Verrucomicrobiales bacterium]|nr:flavin reductase family protein [Verrucomicrobiales bacterium]